MLAELLDWAPWAAATFGVLTLFAGTLAVAERYVRAASDEVTRTRLAPQSARRAEQ